MDDLRKVQLLQLKMAKEIKRVCEKYGISYSMLAGTMLGAVRHEGFIPWDDDLDIGMLRGDYDRFLAVAPKEMGGDYFVQTWDTDPQYALPFAKVRLEKTRYTEKNAGEAVIHDGIYVDVFVFDNIPEQPRKQKAHKRVTYLLQRMLLAKNGYCLWDENETGKKRAYQVLKAVSAPFSLRSLQKKLDREMRRYDGAKTEWVTAIGGSYGYEREKLRREWLENRRDYPFEDTTLPGPADADAYLTSLYGDYMTPPPESERENRHGITAIDFGPYVDEEPEENG